MREVDLDVFASELAEGAFAIDVREPDEYRAGHVPGVRTAPLSELGAHLPALPADRLVYVICASGNRSAWAAEHLEAVGVRAVSVAGGTSGWAGTGRPIVRGTAPGPPDRPAAHPRRASSRLAGLRSAPARFVERFAVFFAQYYLDCLSQASYMIADEKTGQAVVVDPRRDVSEYLADAQAHGFTVVGVINTHFHADFVAGHLEMADETGAWIGYGSRAETEYPVRHLAEGERIVLGEVVLEVMETPGHTPESISVLVYERAEDEVPYGVLTGDALFIGDVGRPDLLASTDVTAEELGAMLHDSVQNRLMGLPDEVRVFPAHGAGSACGKNLSTEKSSTIGEQRATNYACAPMSREEFVALVTAGQSAAPGYFAYDADLNRKDRPRYDGASASRPLSQEEFAAVRTADAVVVDARDPQEFAAGHLAGAVNIPADGRFAEQAGTVLNPADELVVMAPQNREEEVVTRLARIGFDHVVGYVRNPEDALQVMADEVAPASRLTTAHLKTALAGENPPLVVDVRTCGEREANGFLPQALHIPLSELPSRTGELPADQPLVLHCAGGHRSSIAASLLRHRGFGDVSDILGGWAAWALAAETTQV